ncbi:MAG: hypothetical protein Q4B75_06185 [Eubacteriales bacterium]|nr:hypothetical protein [Eubacteriales bacterium]
MNDTELRRKELLESARSAYSDKYCPPLVHPRYKNVCLREDEKEEQSGTFGLRALLCCIILTAFIIAEYKDLEIMHVNSEQIINAVENSDLLEVWKDL